MDANQITLRMASAHERRGILNLIENGYKCVWDEAYLKWKYDRCPFGEVITWVAECQGKIIGMRSLRPLRMSYHGKDHRVALYLDLAVHSDFRRKGIFSRLVDLGTQWTSQHEYDLSITFPNKRSIGEYERRQDWAHLGSLDLVFKPLSLTQMTQKKLGTFIGKVLALPLNAIQNLIFSKNGTSERDNLNIELVEAFPKRVGEISNNLSSKLRIVRDKDYLDWRYAQNPKTDFIKLVAFSGSKLRGFAIGVVRKVFGLKIGLIADIAGDHDILDSLLDEICRVFMLEGADAVGIAISRRNPIYTRLTQKGRLYRLPDLIAPKKFEMFVNFHDKTLASSELSKLSNWFITWGDWDVLEGAGVSL